MRPPDDHFTAFGSGKGEPGAGWNPPLFLPDRFVTHDTDGTLVNTSIGTGHVSRYFWLAESLDASPITESPQPE